MSSKFWWISTRASPDLPTGFIYQIHCGIYGPSKICHGCHESWVTSDDDISFKLFECMTSKSEHLRTSWTKLSMSSGRKPPTSRNFQRITKVNDLDHARKPTRGPCRSTFDAFGKPNWCLLFDAEEQPQQWHPKAARVEIHTAMNLWSGVFRTAKSARVSWAKRIQAFVCATFVCVSMSHSPQTKKWFHFLPNIYFTSASLGCPSWNWSTKARFSAPPGPCTTKFLPAPWQLGWLVMLIRIIDLGKLNDMIYHDIHRYTMFVISGSLEQPCSEIL